MAKLVADTLNVELRTLGNVGRNAEGQYHTGNGGMDATLQHTVPEEQARVEIESFGADALPVAYAQDSHEDGGEEQVPEVEMLGIADGNHYDSAQVVGHGERRQEHLQPNRATLAEDTQASQREGNVGSHGDGHASLHDGMAPADKEEDNDRHNHASAGTNDGGTSRFISKPTLRKKTAIR